MTDQQPPEWEQEPPPAVPPPPLPSRASLFPGVLDPNPDPDEEVDEDEEVEDEDRPVVMYRGAGGDTAFGYLIAIALSIGLTPFIPANADLRYVIVWGVLAAFGVLAWLLGSSERIERETPNNLAWGVIFGLIVSAPLLAVGSGTLATTSRLLFRAASGTEILPLPLGAALGLLVFVQPLAETLFFRALLQENRSFWIVGLLAWVWSMLLFFPLLDIGRFPVVGIIIGTALLMMNLMYSYVRDRNGLAAAWLCQITVNIMLMFVPFVGG